MGGTETGQPRSEPAPEEPANDGKDLEGCTQPSLGSFGGEGRVKTAESKKLGPSICKKSLSTKGGLLAAVEARSQARKRAERRTTKRKATKDRASAIQGAMGTRRRIKHMTGLAWLKDGKVVICEATWGNFRRGGKEERRRISS